MQRQPNFENLRRTILRQGPPGPVPFFDVTADLGMVEAVLGEKFPIDLSRYVDYTADLGMVEAVLEEKLSIDLSRHVDEAFADVSADDLQGLMKAADMYVRFWCEMGYDYVPVPTDLDFQRHLIPLADTAALANRAGGERYWQDETSGPIQSWKDFEAYPWPKVDQLPHIALQYVNAVLPEGMKICAQLFGGVFANARYLMGFQSLCYALHDQPDLVEAVCQRVGELVTAAATQVVTYDNVGMLVETDDMGFHSGTLVSPDVIRHYILPHHKRIAEVAHGAGKLFALHSCGNVHKLMDDFIDYVGIDAKHSFEDKILPVEEVYRRWGDRVTILGGVDMDLLGRGTEDQVRARTREILEVCGTKGTGYCLGTGNSVANYIPVRNYLAMLDEGRRWNREHFGGA